MSKHPYANNIEDFKYLKPPKKLLEKAERELRRIRKTHIKKGILERRLYYTYITIKRGALMAYEFILFTKSQTAESIFEISEVIDFKKRNILISEKKQFVYIGGWVYRPTYDYFLYAYHETSKRDLGNSLRRADIYIEDPKVTNLKINDYLTIPTRHIFYEEIQKIMNKDPNEIEFLYRNDYKHLMPNKMSKKFLEFVKIHNKHLKHLSLIGIRQHYKVWSAYKGKKNIQQVKNILSIYQDYNIHKYSIKEIPRVVNLIDNGTTSKHLTDFTTACKELDVDRKTEIFKGLKIREAIINEYNHKVEAKRVAEEQRRLERLRKETNEKARKAQLANRTLEQITKNFKHVEVENFEFIPLKSIKDFTEVSNTLSLCLIQNEYYNNVKREEQLIYLVTPKGKTMRDSEVVQFYNRKGGLEVGQVSAYKNKKSENHDIIVELAKQMTKEDLISV